MLVSGIKRVVLFPPTDALFMYLQGVCSHMWLVTVIKFMSVFRNAIYVFVDFCVVY